MAKYLLIALGLFFALPAFSQESVVLNGIITADSLQESAVHIINITQKTGTVNSGSGSFKIPVRENDTLLFSSIQYNNLQVPVTRKVMEEVLLAIQLTIDINELAEVNVSNTSLTGNITTDLNNIKVVKNLPLTFSAADLKTKRYESDINDPLQKPIHLAAMQNEIVQMGGPGASIDILGLANLVGGVFGVKSKDKPLPKGPVVLVSTQIRTMFKDDFFTSSLSIPQESIGDFIFHLDDAGISAQLLKDENRLALIEFLIDQGKKYNSLPNGR